MSTLKQFLKENPVDNLIEKVKISERLKAYEFTVKALRSKEHSQIINECTNISANKKIQIDSDKLTKKIISAYCVEPNFKDAKDIEDMGVNTPDEYIERVLTAGEQQNLLQAIYDLSGLNKSFSQLVEEVKN